MSRKDERKENYYFKKQRVGLVLVSALASLGILGFTQMSLGGMIAQIQNSINTARTGSLKMKETNEAGDIQCESTQDNTTNTATCATINKYGGTDNPLIPGGQGNTTVIKIENTGDIPATAFSVTGGACAVTPAVGAAYSGSGSATLCDHINVSVKVGQTVVFEGTAKAFQDAGATNILGKLGKQNIAVGETTTLTINAKLNATADSTHQGLQVSQPITWQFGA